MVGQPEVEDHGVGRGPQGLERLPAPARATS